MTSKEKHHTMIAGIPKHAVEESILDLAEIEERQERLDLEQARLDAARARVLATVGRGPVEG